MTPTEINPADLPAPAGDFGDYEDEDSSPDQFAHPDVQTDTAMRNG